MDHVKFIHKLSKYKNKANDIVKDQRQIKQCSKYEYNKIKQEYRAAKNEVNPLIDFIRACLNNDTCEKETEQLKNMDRSLADTVQKLFKHHEDIYSRGLCAQKAFMSGGIIPVVSLFSLFWDMYKWYKSQLKERRDHTTKLLLEQKWGEFELDPGL